MNDYATLHQKPTFFVVPVFYGGPLDGLRGVLLVHDAIKGAIKQSGGVYQLQGFRATSQFGADHAVYVWEASR